VRIIPPPPPENAATRLLRRVRVDGPYSYKHVTIFPLSLRAPTELSDVYTMAQAVARDWLVVRERKKAEVPYVTVRNSSPHYVFCLAGEIVAGGKQNRVVRNDLLLPPHSGDVLVSVYCVEKGRWAGARVEFEPAAGLVHPKLRKSAAMGASQDSVWREIESCSRRLGVSSSTEDYRQVYEDADVRRRLEEFVRPFCRLPSARRVGAVVAVGGRIVGCDLFSDDKLFGKLWDKILRSYVLDCAHGAELRRGVGRDDVRRFLERAVTARYSEQSTPGAGRLLRISRGVDGAALLWRNDVVHLMLHPDDEVHVAPEER